MRVMLFAGLAEACGRRELMLDALPAELTVAQLDALVRECEPALVQHRFRIAVNRRYARPEDPVQDADEIALIPPVSGGAA